MGLPPQKRGNTLRPDFSDVVCKPGDRVAQQSVNLWGSGFSSRGYREWAARGLIEMPQPSIFRILPPFVPEFEAQLQGFHFEELLVWLFAFSGFPDHIDGWSELFGHFQDVELGAGNQFPPVYQSRFNTDNGVPWPVNEITSDRPKNPDFQKHLIPSAYSPAESQSEAFVTKTHLSEDDLATLVDLIHDKGQLVLYGPPGTGKTFVARELALYLTGNDPGRIEVVQFHPSYGYEDFVIGLRPEIDPDSGQLTYGAVEGAFLRVSENAQESGKPFVVIVDEINRGNLPRIFGELMYLLEYRKDSDHPDTGANALSEASIPHREDPFSVPPNVFLIATMNTSDRSIGQIDLALRRRFHFFPLGPNEQVLRSFLESTSAPAAGAALRLFKKVNERVREMAGIDIDIIGHSFFMHKDLTEHRLRSRYEYSVMPMLQEVFYARPDLIAKFFTYDTLLGDAPPPDQAVSGSGS